MTTEDLYAEMPCSKCGKPVLQSSSFCPYCGHVFGEAWFDRFRARPQRGLQGGRPWWVYLAKAIAAAIVVGAVVLAADSISDGRWNDVVGLGMIIFISLRAIFQRRKSSSPAQDRHAHTTAATLSCPHCGSGNDPQATRCSRCGKRLV